MKSSRQIVLGGIGVILAAAGWQLAALGPLADSPLPSATQTLSALAGMAPTEKLWEPLGATVLMAVGGLVIATVLGVIIGLVVATSPLFRYATRIPIESLKPIPPIVVLPIIALVMGPTTQMGMVLIVLGLTLGIVMQTAAGVRDVDPVAIDTAYSFGMSRLEVLWRVILPSALAHIGTAVRIAAPMALVVAVVAGLLGGAPGLGRSILASQISNNQPDLFAFVLVLGIVGLVFIGISQFAERRLLHWHAAYRAGETA
ncbi:ABC transporter permease [Mycetocola sp.]|uniref:ABC transporter permease n=1 Tax=Mycetocola sp. TaxID=1871042 RepID=UPI003989AF35